MLPPIRVRKEKGGTPFVSRASEIGNIQTFWYTKAAVIQMCSLCRGLTTGSCDDDEDNDVVMAMLELFLRSISSVARYSTVSF